MSVKSEISSDYIQLCKEKFPSESKRSMHVWITGDKRDKSIGQAIRLKLDENWFRVTSFEGNVCFSRHKAPRDVDTLIMCHGEMHLDWFENTPIDIIKNVIETNLQGSINVTQAFVRQTIDNTPRRKKIISIGSMAYKAVLNGSAAYCASKAGLAHFMKCIAWELAPKGFDVYSIHPSNTEGTPMSNETVNGLMSYRKITEEQAIAYWSDNNPRESFLTREEIADLVHYICSGKAPYLSGCNLELAGGQR